MAMTPFQIEAWVEYAVGITILFSRLIYRTKLVGFKNWAGDDYFAVASVCFLTVRHTTTEERKSSTGKFSAANQFFPLKFIG